MKIIVYTEDRAYGAALCSALAESFEEAQVRWEEGDGSGSADEREGMADAEAKCDAGEGMAIVEMEGGPAEAEEAGRPVQRFPADPCRPFAELRSRIAAALPDAGPGRTIRPDRDPSDCCLVCFTAACGGIGCSSCAKMFADVMASVYGRKTLYLSLERFPGGAAEPGPGPMERFLFRLVSDPEHIDPKALPLQPADSCGVLSPALSAAGRLADASAEEMALLLGLLAEKTDLRSVVIDLPAECRCFEQLPAMCEHLVQVKGRSADCADRDAAMEGSLKSRYADRYEAFCPSECSAFEGDVHSGLGKEVRELAQRLEMQG